MTTSVLREATRYGELDAPPRILLGPGPSLVHPRVMRAMTMPLVGHLDPFFLEVLNRTQDLLRYVFQTENALTLAVPGTGSAGMEAAIANLVEPGDSVLVCINGFFGGRLAEMARRHGGQVRTISRPWGEVFTPAEIKAALDEQPAKIVALVHAETSTGAEQPLEEIIKLVHARGGIVIVDAVTSLGGLPLRADELGIDACYSGSQKCLGAPPGLAPITLGPRAVEKLRARRSPVASWYLDLSLLEKYWDTDHAYHHTAPIATHYAFCEALRLLAEEGLEARWARHRANAELLWTGLGDLGLKLHVPHEHRLPSLTTVHIPDGVDDLKLRRQLLDEYNIEIAGGLGELKGKIWRIGLMGYSSNKDNILLLLSVLHRLLG